MLAINFHICFKYNDNDNNNNLTVLLDLTARRALTGLRNIMPTIMMGKMEIELPAMYIMNRFIGICLNGPSAISHDFWKWHNNKVETQAI